MCGECCIPHPNSGLVRNSEQQWESLRQPLQFPFTASLTCPPPPRDLARSRDTRHVDRNITARTHREPSIRWTVIVTKNPAHSASIATHLESAGLRTLVLPHLREAAELSATGRVACMVLFTSVDLDPTEYLEDFHAIRSGGGTSMVLIAEDWAALLRHRELGAQADSYLHSSMPLELMSDSIMAVTQFHDRVSSDHGVTVDAHLGITVDRYTWTATVDGWPIDLTATQFELLSLLMSRPDHVFTRDELTAHIWGTWYGSDHHLDVHISRLRSAIVAAGGPRVPHAVRGVGFRLRG